MFMHLNEHIHRIKQSVFVIDCLNQSKAQTKLEMPHGMAFHVNVYAYLLIFGKKLF